MTVCLAPVVSLAGIFKKFSASIMYGTQKSWIQLQNNHHCNAWDMACDLYLSVASFIAVGKGMWSTECHFSFYASTQYVSVWAGGWRVWYSVVLKNTVYSRYMEEQPWLSS